MEQTIGGNSKPFKILFTTLSIPFFVYFYFFITSI